MGPVMQRVSFASVAFFLAFSGPEPQPLNATVNSVTVFFRYDDYSAESDTSLERRLVDFFRRHGLRLTVAAIPAVCAGNVHDHRPQEHLLLAGEKARLLRDAVADGTVEVALHGYSHQTLAGVPSGRYSEFRGLTLHQAGERIQKGKEILEKAIGRPIVIFVPPWNPYDVTTERALEELGFLCLSAGPGKASSARLRYLPATLSLHSLRAAVSRAREVADPGTVAGVLFHDYEFLGFGFGRQAPDVVRKNVAPWDTFQRDVEWLVRQPDVRISLLGHLLCTEDDFEARRLNLNRPQWLVPPRWNS